MKFNYTSQSYKDELLKEKMVGIGVDVVVNYLTKRGWKDSDFPNKKLQVFTHKDKFIENISGTRELMQVVLPAHDNFEDSYRMVVSTMEFIAFMEEVDFEVAIELVKNEVK